MIDLPGGSFRMGSPDTDEMAREDEKPAHLAEVTGFRRSVTPVTAGLYAEVVQIETPPDSENSCQQSMSPGTTPSSFAIGYPEGRGIDRATGNTSGTGSATGALTAIVCQQRPSGNTPAEREPRRVTRSGMILDDSSALPGSPRAQGRTMSPGRLPILGGCMTCMAMSENGVGTGTSLTP